MVPSKVFKSLNSDWPIMFGIFSSNKSEDFSSFSLDLYDDKLKLLGPTVIKNQLQSYEIGFRQREYTSLKKEKFLLWHLI